MPGNEELLTAKELAIRLKKSRTYVYAMKARGFRMPGGVSTIGAALVWLTRHPKPRKSVP
jgi:hypothetical protein